MRISCGRLESLLALSNCSRTDLRGEVDILGEVIVLLVCCQEKVAQCMGQLKDMRYNQSLNCKQEEGKG